MGRIQGFFELVSIVIIVLIRTLPAASATNLDLSSSPLFLANNAPPNILIILDNSDSTDFEIMAKPHWERAAYEYSYASGYSHTPTDKDITEGHELETCSEPDGDCGGILRKDGTITLSGPDLANAQGCTSPTDNSDNCNPQHPGNFARNFLSYQYLSSCYDSFEQAPCCANFFCIDDNSSAARCIRGTILTTGEGIFSLANCPETEALDWRVRSAGLNTIYYNPNINYKSWKLSDLQEANFTTARSNPYSNHLGYSKQVNLGEQAPLGIDPTSCTRTSPGTPCLPSAFNKGFVYYVWIDDKGYSGNRPRRGTNINMTGGSNGMVDLWDSRYKVTVTVDSMKVEKITCSNTYNQDGSLNCTSTGPLSGSAVPASVIPNRTLAEEQQNIANWFQYYRRRVLTIKAMISEVPYVAPNYRYGLMSMSYDQSQVIIANDQMLGPLGSITVDPAQELIFEFPRPDTQTQFVDFQQHNMNMLNALLKLSYSRDTRTRETLNRAGMYYKYKDANNNPLILGTQIDPIIDQCQRNYSLIITDGYYTIPPIDQLTMIGDADSDGSSTTLADVARYYYVHDLRSDLDNILTPTSCDDPLTYPNYQHMVTFGISLGVNGTLTDANGDGWPDNIVNPPIWCPPPAGHTNTWSQAANSSWGNQPTACGDCPKKIDDLWHAAYNSHGAYTFAQDPEKLRSALLGVLNQISTARSFTTSASNASLYSSGSSVFLTSFESQYWTGDLKAFAVDAQKGNLGDEIWSAARELNNTRYTDRKIFSYKPVQHQPIDFKWGQLDSTQQNALNSDGKGEVRVQFLQGRGAGTGVNREDNWIRDNNFRTRSGGVLGDIIQSDPVYVGQPVFRYDEYACTECSAYQAFKSTPRNSIVYVGANDGMLHGFGATDGKEKIAYIPGNLVDRLISLTSRQYVHRYFVDGSAMAADAFFSGAWHTVLASGLRAGGQAVFALDITDPANFSTANVLWEFSDNDDPDLGYSFSKPTIARLHDGKWVAIFGNGYNNTEPDGNDPNDNTKRNDKTVVSNSGEAVLYVYYLDNSTPQFIKIHTGVGKSQDPTHANRPNGLATPAIVDVDDDLNADYVYVGDLFGNLWKFDIRNSNPDNWQVVKLFQAVDNQNNPQPITVRPEVNYHPIGRAFGQIIYFGTGKYFENNDNQYSGATQQSFYGIWDYNVSAGSSAFNRNTPATGGCQPLFEQRITPVGTDFRKLTPASGSIQWLDSSGAQCNKGWYMDFPLGEKQISDPTIRNKRVIFTTLVLPQNPQTCDSDGSSSWLMVVDANDGGTPKEVTFDLNGDFKFNQADLALMGGENVAGQQSQVGAQQTPSLTYYPSPPPPDSPGGGNSGGGDSGSVSCGGSGSVGIGCVGALVGNASGITGTTATTIINPGRDDCGRQSWRQLWR